MLEILLTIILLPVALVVLAIMGFAVYKVWQFIVAGVLWVFAGLYYMGTGNEGFWWAFGAFMLGCALWVAGAERYQHLNKK